MTKTKQKETNYLINCTYKQIRNIVNYKLEYKNLITLFII